MSGNSETTPQKPAARSKRPLIALGLAGLAAAIGAIYFIGGGESNIETAKSCNGALSAATAVKPFAKGEVAALLPAQKPLYLGDLTFFNAEDKPVQLKELGGKVVLLNLWATWCAPCRKEMPALDRLQAKAGGEKFNVVTVNLDRGGPEKPKAFLNEIGVSDLRYYSDASNGIFNDLRSKARAMGLPTTILVDAESCEIGTMYGPAEWDSEDALRLIDAAISAGAPQS